jgi:hypothetical protein
MPKHLVTSTSGNSHSNSRRMGRVAFAHLQKKKADCEWIDRFAFATSHAFNGEHVSDKKVTQRIEQVADELVRFTKALRS